MIIEIMRTLIVNDKISLEISSSLSLEDCEYGLVFAVTAQGSMAVNC